MWKYLVILHNITGHNAVDKSKSMNLKRWTDELLQATDMPVQHCLHDLHQPMWRNRLRCLAALNDSISAVSSTPWVMPWNLWCFKICQEQADTVQPEQPNTFFLLMVLRRPFILSSYQDKIPAVLLLLFLFYFICFIKWSTFQHCIQIKLPQLDFWLVDMNAGCSQFYFRKFLIEWCGMVEWQQK